jgi:uncharacterized protein (DUF1499 family)
MTNASRIDFPTFKRARTPNTFLIAPEGLCKNAKTDVVSPVYAVSASALRQALLRVVIPKPRLSHSFKDDAALYDDFIVRSALFRFLDIKGGRSTYAIYSRSVYGRSDLGVNRARTMAWIKELNASIAPISP